MTEELIKIYSISNSANFLYGAFRNRDEIIQLSKKDTIQLIEEFKMLSSKEITKLEELVKAYAVFISLTLKPLDEVRKFFEETDITFEWFNAIKKIFLANIKSSALINLQSPFSPEIQVNQKGNY